MPEQLPNLDAWLRSILWDTQLPVLGTDVESKITESGNLEIHRLKAKLPLSTGDIKIVQGVRDVFEILDASQDPSAEMALEGKIVLIGRYLLDKPFKESFIQAMGPT